MRPWGSSMLGDRREMGLVGKLSTEGSGHKDSHTAPTRLVWWPSRMARAGWEPALLAQLL